VRVNQGAKYTNDKRDGACHRVGDRTGACPWSAATTLTAVPSRRQCSRAGSSSAKPELRPSNDIRSSAHRLVPRGLSLRLNNIPRVSGPIEHSARFLRRFSPQADTKYYCPRAAAPCSAADLCRRRARAGSHPLKSSPFTVSGRIVLARLRVTRLSAPISSAPTPLRPLRARARRRGRAPAASTGGRA
jgi:hypothetical protein